MPPPITARLAFPEGLAPAADPRSRPARACTGRRDRAFRELPPFRGERSAHLCRLVLMRLLPAIAARGLEPAADALGEIQRVVGDHFAPFQGGRLHQPGRRRGRRLACRPRCHGRRPELLGPHRIRAGWRRCDRPAPCAAASGASPPLASWPSRAAIGRARSRIWRLIRLALGAAGPVQRSGDPERPHAEQKAILHFITPLKNVSPFDVNMAADAGFDVIVPYTDVDLKEVAGLVQDAMFSRAPEDGRRTAVPDRRPRAEPGARHAGCRQEGDDPAAFRGLGDGRPSGAFTTAAGMIAVVEKHLKAKGLTLEGRQGGGVRRHRAGGQDRRADRRQGRRQGDPRGL